LTISRSVVKFIHSPFHCAKKRKFHYMQVRGIGKTYTSLGPSVHAEIRDLLSSPSSLHTLAPSSADSRHSVYFDKIGRVPDTPVFLLDRLEVANVIRGPAVVVDGTQTIVLVPGCRCVVGRRGLVVMLGEEDEEG
jgi:5-oxoprolinase (ATP-hydrolysing)